VVVDQANGIVVTDYNNGNVLVKKENNSKMVVIMAREDSSSAGDCVLAWLFNPIMP